MDLFNQLKSMEILLIDDDEWIRDSLCVFFESEGCHLTALETAEEGMEALKNHDYDILITDYRLPVWMVWSFSDRFKIRSLIS